MFLKMFLKIVPHLSADRPACRGLLASANGAAAVGIAADLLVGLGLPGEHPLLLSRCTLAVPTDLVAVSALVQSKLDRQTLYVMPCLNVPADRSRRPNRQPPHLQAGYEVIVPKGINASCCGMMFSSRGFAPAAATKMAELEKSLLDASEGGKLPIVCDTSPCLMQIKTSLSTPALRFALYEPVEFINHFLVDKLQWKKVWGTAAHSASSPQLMSQDCLSGMRLNE